jgi:uncharacterized membrane protein
MRLPKVTSRAVLILFLVSAAWLALVMSAPFMVPSGTLTDLTGRVGFHDNDQQFSSLGSLPHWIYWLGDAECHQIAERSYFLNDNQMPFCARDLGIFFGIAAAFGLLTFYRFKINPIFVIIALIPIGIDGGLQLVSDYESNNVLRLLTGALAGAALAMLIAHFLFVIQEDSEKSKRRVQVQTDKMGESPDGGPGKI